MPWATEKEAPILIVFTFHGNSLRFIFQLTVSKWLIERIKTAVQMNFPNQLINRSHVGDTAHAHL